MKRLLALGGILLALIAIVLPVHGSTPEVTRGLWIFKAMLAIHAGLLLVAGRLPTQVSGRLVAPEELQAEAAGPRDGLIIGLLLLVGLGLRLYQLNTGLWFDEIQTLVDYVRLPLDRILTTFDSQNQHLLYTVSAKATVAAFGESAWALRLPAVLFGVASLWALYRLACLVTSRREALLAAGLLTFSFHHVWFSQNARGYTGLLLWTLVASGCFLRLLTGQYRDVRWMAAGYGAAMALAVYVHATAVLVAVAHFLIWGVLLLRRRAGVPGMGRWVPLAALGLAGLNSLLLYAPVLPQFLGTLIHPTKDHADTAWQSPLWLMTEAVRGLSRGVPGGWLVLVLGGLVLLAGLVSYGRQSGAVLLSMVLPGLLTAGAIVALKHNLWPRFFFFSAGFAVLIVIRGGFTLARLVLPARAELVGTVVTIGVILASALTLPRAWGPKQDYAGAARYVEQASGPEDATVTIDLTDYPYQRYYGRTWSSIDTLPALEEIERSHRRTWLLYTFPIRLAAVHPDVWQRLSTAYDTAAVFPGTVGDGAVVVMVSR